MTAQTCWRGRWLALSLAAVLLAGCGSTEKPATTRLTSASTCEAWNHASQGEQQTYIAHALHQPVEGHGHYTLGTEQSFLNRWLSDGCKTATDAGNAGSTQLSAIATAEDAEKTANGEPISTPSTTPSTATTARAPATPAPEGKLAFSQTGHTEQGDVVHVEGRFGSILPPGESDVDQTALESCPGVDGRELVRRLDMTVTILSGLSGDVRIGGFEPQPNDEIKEHFVLDFVTDGSEGAGCQPTVGGANGGLVDLGTLQPHVPAQLLVWIVLPDAITPKHPHPSAGQLASEEWLIGYPLVLVNNATALKGGGHLSVTER